MTWAVALLVLSRLAGGVAVPGPRLEIACRVLADSLARLHWSAAEGDSARWRTVQAHWDSWAWNAETGGWDWTCSWFEPERSWLLVRESEGGERFEALSHPVEADSVSFVVTYGHTMPFAVLSPGGCPGAIVHDPVEVEVASDARRRVLARRLWGLLPAPMRVP